jgi:photosystem II stability/assembly factor-like uncharacterized protein
MNDRLLIGTKKGLFELRRSRGEWSIAATRFLGDPISMLLADSRDGTLYAAEALGHFGVKLQRSRDNGETWQEIAAPAFPKTGTEGASVSYLFCLEPGAADQPGWVWCGTIPGALFLSKDHGETWSINEPLWNLADRQYWMGGGFDDAGVASICIDPRDAAHMTLGVSTGGVWISEDGGASWRGSVDGMYADYAPPEHRHQPAAQDIHRLVQCPAAPDTMWVQHHNGVFRSTDAARSWREVTTIKPSKFGFAVAVHPRDPDTAWFVPGVKDECRVPTDGRLVVARTRDGARSFEVLRNGLPQEHAYDLIYRHALAVDDTGTRLAMGSTTGHLWVTEDSGDNWTMAAGHLPPISSVRFG